MTIVDKYSFFECFNWSCIKAINVECHNAVILKAIKLTPTDPSPSISIIELLFPRNNLYSQFSTLNCSRSSGHTQIYADLFISAKCPLNINIQKQEEWLENSDSYRFRVDYTRTYSTIRFPTNRTFRHMTLKET